MSREQHNFHSRDSNVGYWGNRDEISIRVNYGNILESNVDIGDPLHGHKIGIQHFFVIHGELVVEVEGNLVSVNKENALEISPSTPYRVLHASVVPCEYIVVCTVNDATDRVEY